MISRWTWPPLPRLYVDSEEARLDDKAKYLEILKVGMQDVAEDIKLLVGDYETRRKAGEITNYVLLENLALLTHEIHGVESFLALVEEIQPDQYSSLDEMIADIDTKVGELIEHVGHDPVLYQIVRRKLTKLAVYVAGV